MARDDEKYSKARAAAARAEMEAAEKARLRARRREEQWLARRDARSRRPAGGAAWPPAVSGGAGGADGANAPVVAVMPLGFEPPLRLRRRCRESRGVTDTDGEHESSDTASAALRGA